MRSDQFKRINGYPNRYWGWGGKIIFLPISNSTECTLYNSNLIKQFITPNVIRRR